jgi:outer membrane autotransporter protein
VAGLALAGLSGDARAQTAFTNSSAQTGTTSFYSLTGTGSGDSLTNTAAGSLTINAVGTQPAVVTSGGAAAFIFNQGTIQSQQDPGGIAIGILPSTSLGTIANSGTGLIQASGSLGSAINVAGGLGQLLNSATIQGSGVLGSGVNVVSGGSVGAVTNSAGGTIAANNSPATAFLVSGGTVTSLTNNGTIIALGINGTGIGVQAGGVGTIVNGQTGQILATGQNGTGINVQSTVGFIINQGLISTGTGSNGTGINVVSTGLVQGITNAATGTIVSNGSLGTGVNIAGQVLGLVNQGLMAANGAGGVGVNVVSGASVGTIGNSGTVQANGTGGTGVQLGGTVTALNNSGSIQANGINGVGIGVTGLVTAVNNSGTVSANGPGGSGVSIAATGLVQALTNAAGGLISATGVNGSGVLILSGGVLNTLQNNGTIIASDPTGVGVNTFGLLGTINNNGTIQGGAANGSGTAINLTNAPGSTTINNTGSIVGGITVASNSTVNLNGGTVSGNINGNSNPNNVVNFSGGSVGAGFTIASISTVNVNTGAITVGTGGVALVNEVNVNIFAGAMVNLNGAIGASATTNNGVVNVGSGAGSIAGSYNQGVTGQLVITVIPTGAGSLNVGGAATINSTGPAIALNFAPSNLSGPSSFTALTASGGVTTSQPPTATSNSLNPYFDFPIVTKNPTTLVVTFSTPTLPQIDNLYCTLFCGATGGLTSTGGRNQIAAIGGVGGLVDALVTGGDKTDVTNIFATLRGLSPAQQALFFSQVQPSQIGAAAALMASALSGNGGLTTSIDDRVYAMLNGRGMAAGDEVGRGFTVWVKPYGETFTQNNKEAVNGFTASAYGVAAGADTMIRPDVRLGGAVSLGNTNFNFAGSQSGNTATDLSFQAGVYGTYFANNFFFDGIGAFGLHSYDTKENISAFGYQRISDYNGVQFSAKVTGGYDWHAASGMVVTPSVTFQEIHVDMDAHQTSGAGVFNLNVSGQHFDVMQLKLGGRVAYPMPQPSGWVFTPEAHAYYVRNLILSRVQSSASFVTGGVLTVSGPQRDPDLADLGLGLTVAQKGPFALSAVYDYTFGQTSFDNQFFLRLKTEF